MNGRLTFGADQNLAGLYFTGTQTLSGNGQAVFAGIGRNNVLLPTSGALTIGPSVTIRGGTGTVGNPTLPLINEGTVSADVPGRIIDVVGRPVTNQGTLKADGAGTTLTVRANPLTNNGAIQEFNGGKVLINP